MKGNIKYRLIVGVMLLFISLTLFWVGRNNNDVCRNELKLERDVNNMLEERNITLKIRFLESNMVNVIGLEDCHTKGLFFMQIGISIMFISGLMIGRFV